ncbi:sel1 repeat family protein [Streptomyces sp. NBC_01390]|uniref:sel1 repeat family protein n=1 Tax=Streptomyces sp. NBC_01390 TaxID=2903850 RepID=UPI003243BF8C
MGRIRVEAAGRGVLHERVDGSSGETAEELLDEARWRTLWEAEQHSRVRVVRGGVERRQALRALEDEERRARQAVLADRPRPVRSWSQQRLGVHPSIPGRGVAATGFVLPTFVPRPHDARFRETVSAACAEGASPRFVVVCGASCTGKSRTACEALAAVPDDFDLIFPADAEGLLAALAADALGPRTVLWLNEAHRYFDTPVGNAVAAALLRRLDGNGPFLVIATLWPDQMDALTTRRLGPEQDNPHRSARDLFRQARRIDLPRSFADDLDAVRRAATQDASLATALEIGGENLTQVLAAGPDLVRHYEQPAGEHGIYGSALLAVAMDAHRLGLPLLPLSFLEAAAPGYLTDQQRSEAGPDWFTGALTYVRTLIKDTTRPLQEVPRPSGMGALPGVLRLADYLQQHGRQTRWARCPPPSFWEAASVHLTNGADLTRLADEAQARGRFRYASLLYGAAVRMGSLEARVVLARTREYAGDREGALRVVRPAAEQGYTGAMVLLAFLHNRAGDRPTALGIAHAAARSGAPYASLALGLLRQGGTVQRPWEMMPSPPWDPESWYERELRPLIQSLTGQALFAGRYRKLDQAKHLAYDAAKAGAPYALARIALLLKWRGDEQGAARLYRLAVDAGHLGALGGLARIHNESPDAYMRLGLETDGSLATPWTWDDPDSPPADHTPGPN